MASSRSSALNNTAFFAGGALVGAGLYTLARSMVAQKRVAADAAPTSDAAAAKSAAILDTPYEKEANGLFVSPATESDPLYDEYGVMGIPYEARGQLPPVSTLATHMDLEEAHAALSTHAMAAASFDKPILINSLLAIELLAYHNSNVVFSYESGASGGFGAYCEAQERAAAEQHKQRAGAKVYAMQARAGAGSAIAGFLLGEGTADAPVSAAPKPVTVLINAQGFQAMGPALASIQTENRKDLVVHVSSASQTTSDELEVTNDYAATLATAALLGEAGFEVVLSSTRAEAVEFTRYAYTRKADKPLVHIFDGAFAGSEVGRTVVPGPKAAAPKPVQPFAYTGPAAPETVLVLPNGSLALQARALLVSLPAALRSKVGVVSVRALFPWSTEALRKVLPESAKVVRVVEEAYTTVGGPLYSELLAASLSGELGTSRIQSLVLAPGQELAPAAWHELLVAAAESQRPINLRSVLDKAESGQAKLVDLLALSSAQLVTIVGSDKGTTTSAAPLLADALFGQNASLNVRLLSRFDNFHGTGSVRSDLVFSERADEIPMPVLARDGASHALVVNEPSEVLKNFAVLDAVRENGTVLFNAAGWTQEDVEGALYAADKRRLAERNVSVFVVDAAKAAEGGKGKGVAEAAPGAVVASLVEAVTASPKNALSQRLPKLVKVASVVDAEAAAEAKKGTKAVDTSSFASATPAEGEEEALQHRPAHLTYNAFSAKAAEDDEGQAVVRASWAFAAWQMLFREAYHLDDHASRPDLPEKTYNVQVSVNKRLTPLDYDRNLFHMELDTKGTGLKYEVGEALGVHGWNDDEEVARFIRWSGYNPEEIVSAPSVIHPGEFESRTVYQVLQQNLDIFGKPPKSFFEALGKAVASKDEERWLRFISSAEGASTFRKLSEDETVTYVDVLHMFPTARVTIDWLIKNVEPIKPRHYSIASAQVAVGDSVHLLIVTVDWKTPRGSLRFGQCTRYLSRLTPGTKVTVSIKPSVMKLPPLDTQPIIMAGLGTGAAPFRAFLQARAHQRSLGKEVGPLYYYFGSRHQAKEYLYGEELEAYLSDGLLTHLGLAFSRDQQKKVYIQHKIKEDGHMLTSFLAPELGSVNDQSEEAAEALVDEGRKGIFTLCGPVWPVPDIQEALVSAFVERGWTKEQAEAKIESLKDDERYVLEVY
ncbi:assimilatory sulfite reductase (NADPH) [Malassezia japonica]|uniref:assimilatory sulfite reductase (NADPH) n=1 Tax=Malassezia japonica TaxID=223818 RepID=A0AAF0F3T0_9BASI|nr:assimilatory sulfite reductase (NADPH) [Malassezia japonica]WFD39939.1 assimilatory sulfite reductase (NADPH) [Malassezia japonica]